MNYTIRQTEQFASWHRLLRDLKAKHAITRRIDRAAAGNLGDVKPVGEGVFEMRVDVGAGYRLYFGQRERTIIVLFCGGDKSTQEKDIKRAIQMKQED